MKQLLSLIFFSVGILHARSQQVYITKGKIEFEKTVNTYKVLEENYAGSDNTMWAEAFKKSMAKTGSSYFDLYFSNDKSLYKPGREVIVAQRPPDWVNGQATDNIVLLTWFRTACTPITGKSAMIHGLSRDWNAVKLPRSLWIQFL